MRIGIRSDIGKVRNLNEDVAYASGELGLFLVADGMGGHNGGEVASQTALTELLKACAWDQIRTPEDLEEPLNRVNRAVWEKSRTDPALRGMGTTLTMAKVVGTDVLIGHIGDSRAYVVNPRGELRQVTKDHSLVEELVRTGSLSEGEARVHPHRNFLTRALGTQPNVKIDVIRFRLNPGDICLLCTDGLIREIEPEEIGKIIVAAPDLQAAADELVNLANARGGHDNVTVVLFAQ